MVKPSYKRMIPLDKLDSYVQQLDYLAEKEYGCEYNDLSSEEKKEIRGML